MLKLKPLGDRVLVKPEEEKEEKRGGIIIPDTAKEKPMVGQVMAVGPGKLDDKGQRVHMNVKAGDRVLFGKYAGNEVKLDGEELMIMNEDDIYGILEG
ncbi:MAG: co-chaperone GroES [candidate division FCPU426 bacterium]